VTKRELGVWGYNWATLSLWDMNTETWPSQLGVGCKADGFVRKKIIVMKLKEVETGSNLAESAKEGYGSKGAVLPVMTVI
jgi:hypothetical protein